MLLASAEPATPSETFLWPVPRVPPTLKVGEVHVWAVSLEQPLASARASESLLSVQELNRAQRFRSDRARGHVAWCGDLATPQIRAVASVPHGTRSLIRPRRKRPRQTLAPQGLRPALRYEVDQGRLVFALHDVARKWRRGYRTPDIPSAK
jgi:hypothetical protein